MHINNNVWDAKLCVDASLIVFYYSAVGMMRVSCNLLAYMCIFVCIVRGSSGLRLSRILKLVSPVRASRKRSSIKYVESGRVFLLYIYMVC